MKSFLKKIPGLLHGKRALLRLRAFTLDRLNLHGMRGSTKLDIPATFPLYQPCSACKYKDRAALTIQTINHLPAAIVSFAQSLAAAFPKRTNVLTLVGERAAQENAERLKQFLDLHGSDKASVHNYYLLYSHILAAPTKVNHVLEIGLGTNNTDVVSHMGTGGQVGASLRAFRDFLPHAQIYGADIDRRVLFSERRIETFYVDQTRPHSFAELARSLPNEFDLMIDDGLHSPDANINSLGFFLPRLKVNGWAVVEDIGPEAAPVWNLVSSLLPDNFSSSLYDTRSGLLLFAVRRLS